MTTADLTGLSGYGYIFNGANASDQAGTAVLSADLNGDGIGDLVIAAPGASPGGVREWTSSLPASHSSP